MNNIVWNSDRFKVFGCTFMFFLLIFAMWHSFCESCLLPWTKSPSKEGDYLIFKERMHFWGADFPLRIEEKLKWRVASAESLHTLP